ncbi:hypothetical protein TNCV_3816121 [Trichonephila clavipes]|nr:hypothetical protein TNCV_3816121 [Trichonephila clavipes]
MAADWAGFVSSQAKPGGDILPKSHVQWLGKSSQQPRLSSLSRDRTHSRLCFSWLSKALGFISHCSTFVSVCGNKALCSFKGQGDFRLRLLGSLLGFLVSSHITGDPNMTWDALYGVTHSLDISVRSFPERRILARQE